MVELHTGEALFAGTNEEDQMMKIVEVMGMPPRHMLDQSKVANRFFKRNESDQWVPREHRHRYLKPGTRTLSEVLSKPFARRHGERGHRNQVQDLGPRCHGRSIMDLASTLLRVFQPQAILFLKSISERVRSDIERL